MGAKASSAGNQSPRTFSNSSSSDVVSASNNASLNFLRNIDAVSNDSRQRARSMSAVPDIDLNNIHQASSHNYHNHQIHHHHHHHHHLNAYSNHNSQPFEVVNGFSTNAGAGAHFDLSNSPEDSNSHDDQNPLGISRVVTTSLPSHIWSLNGESIFF
jgi:hypothetical protein